MMARANDAGAQIKDGVEVDVVIENERGQLVGVEVKASATVTAADFAGLRRLQRGAREFVVGYVMYDGARVLPFGDGMYAMPISAMCTA